MSRPGTASGLSGGGSAAKAAQVFRRMDSDNNGGLDFSEMLQALKELGALDGLQAAEITKFLQNEVKEADTDHNGLIDFQEFQDYYQKLARMQQSEARLLKLRANRKNVPPGAEKNAALRSSFRSYCQHGKAHIIGAGTVTNISQDALRMNARQFLRFCKDIGVLKPEGQLDPMTTDVIFAQCKIAGDRHISYKGFVEAISMVSESMCTTFEDLMGSVAGQPSSGADGDDAALKLTSRRPSQRISVVAQSWRKPQAADALERTTPRSSRCNEDSSGLDATGGGAADTKSPAVQKLLAKARSEGMEAAKRGWREEKRALQLHVQELQAVILQMQEDGHEAVSKGEASDLGVRSLSSSLRSELEAIRGEMRTELQKKVAAAIDKWQQNQGSTSSGDALELNKLRLQLMQLEDVVSHLSETQASFATGASMETAPAADMEEAFQALEERALERQARLEAALLQIATKVDVLEKTMTRNLA